MRCNTCMARDGDQPFDPVANEEIQARMVPQPSLELGVSHLEGQANKTIVIAEHEVQAIGLDVEFAAVVVDVVAPVEVEKDEVGLEGQYPQAQSLELLSGTEAGDAEVEDLEFPSGAALAVERFLETRWERAFQRNLEGFHEGISQDGDSI